MKYKDISKYGIIYDAIFINGRFILLNYIDNFKITITDFDNYNKVFDAFGHQSFLNKDHVFQKINDQQFFFYSLNEDLIQQLRNEGFDIISMPKFLKKSNFTASRTWFSTRQNPHEFYTEKVWFSNGYFIVFKTKPLPNSNLPNQDVFRFLIYNEERLVQKIPLVYPTTPKGIIHFFNRLNNEFLGEFNQLFHYPNYCFLGNSFDENRIRVNTDLLYVGNLETKNFERLQLSRIDFTLQDIGDNGTILLSAEQILKFVKFDNNQFQIQEINIKGKVMNARLFGNYIIIVYNRMIDILNRHNFNRIKRFNLPKMTGNRIILMNENRFALTYIYYDIHLKKHQYAIRFFEIKD